MTVKFLWLEPPGKCVCFSGEFGLALNSVAAAVPVSAESLRCCCAESSGNNQWVCRALFCIVTAVAVCFGLLAGESGYGVVLFVAQAVVSVMLNLSVMFFVQL